MMKKIFLFGALALVLAFGFTGCPEGDDDSAASMTFVDNLANPAKEFTIDSNFNFKVTFIAPNATETAMTINPNDRITGKITGANAAWNKDLTGEAARMSSTNDFLRPVLESLDGQVGIVLDYEGEDKITAVTVDFTGPLASQAQLIMGATYSRK
jgi:hypothetical protein